MTDMIGEKKAKRFANTHENYMGNDEQTKELEVHMLLNGLLAIIVKWSD